MSWIVLVKARPEKNKNKNKTKKNGELCEAGDLTVMRALHPQNHAWGLRLLWKGSL